MKHKIEQFFNSEYGFNVRLVPVECINGVERCVHSGYKLWKGSIMGFDVIFIESDNDFYGPAEAMHVIYQIKRNTNICVVYVTEEKNYYEYYRAFKKKRYNLVVPGKLMFCPEFFIMAKTEPKTEYYQKHKDDGKIHPYAQCILIRQMLIGDMNKTTIGDAARKFNVSYGTCQKAFKWLTDNAFAVKRRKLLCFPVIDEVYRKRAIGKMETPLIKSVYVEHIPENMKICEEYAMEHYTMISGSGPVARVCAPELIKNMDKLPDGVGEKACIWKYNPGLITEGKFVDPISLWLTVNDDEDDRIQIEAEKLINKIYYGQRI